MPDQDPQKIWAEYYQRIKIRRIEEAELLWSQMDDAGVSEETVLALDFLHFSNVREDAGSLANQLCENYNVEVVSASQEDYWNIKCTTRPEGICLSKEQHAAWVEFMADVAQSHACVFSTWSLEAPSLGRTFQSELLDT